MKNKQMQRYISILPGIYRSEHDTFLTGNIARGVIETISRKAISPLATQTSSGYLPFFHFSGYNVPDRIHFHNLAYLIGNTTTTTSVNSPTSHSPECVLIKQKHFSFIRKFYRIFDRCTSHLKNDYPPTPDKRIAILTKNFSMLSNPSF